jgi:sulfide:quinone oxidoreductase
MMKSRVLIAGGGVASIEAALALRDLCGDRVSVEVFSASHDFVYRPYAVGEPYGTAHVAKYDAADLLARCGAAFHLANVTSVDCEERRLVTHDGERFPYDYLILAPGIQRMWPVPGAITFWGIADELGVRDVLADLRGGKIGSLAFTMPGTAAWALPMYELALLARADLAAAGVEPRLTIVTPEDAPLEVFGRRASELVATLLAERRIDVVTGRRPVRFEQGRLVTVPGDHFEVEAAVSLPELEGRRIHGVLHDPFGFIRIDEHCRVLKRERLFAAGDVTAFPVKQGGIATQQADVIAEAIAAEVGVEITPQPFEPVLRAELWTGEGSLYLEGWPTGGHGETSTLTAEPPWGRNVGKIVGRYLPDFIAAIDSSRVPAGS